MIANLFLLTFVVAKIDAIQAEYSAFETIHETDGLIETAKELEIAYVAYSPLGHGWLVDDFPFKTPEDFPEGDFRLTSASLLTHILHLSSPPFRANPSFPPGSKFQGENFHNNKAIVEKIKNLATRRGCTITQIALAWVAAQGMIAIPGTTKSARLEANFASRNIDLTKDELREMRKIVDEAKPKGNRYSAAAQSTVGH